METSKGPDCSCHCPDPLSQARARRTLGQAGPWTGRDPSRPCPWPHALARTGNKDAIAAHLRKCGRSQAKARDFAREIVDFYTLPEETLWITFVDGRLWWVQARAEATWLGEGDSHGARLRQTLFPWRDTDLKGRVLAMASLSTKLTQVAAYRQTLCAVEASDYLRRKLLGQEDPVVTQALAARQQALAAASALITALHWADFETLIDLLLARGGWHRVSALGGTLKDADLVVEQPVTARPPWCR
jgi:hypothetical protein